MFGGFLRCELPHLLKVISGVILKVKITRSYFPNRHNPCSLHSLLKNRFPCSNSPFYFYQIRLLT